MLESFNTDAFTYKRLTEEEQNKRGILGRLVGVIADTVNPTRNRIDMIFKGGYNLTDN